MNRTQSCKLVWTLFHPHFLKTRLHGATTRLRGLVAGSALRRDILPEAAPLPSSARATAFCSGTHVAQKTPGHVLSLVSKMRKRGLRPVHYLPKVTAGHWGEATFEPSYFGIEVERKRKTETYFKKDV